MEWTHDDYTLTDDGGRADVGAIHALLGATYWAATRNRDAVRLSIDHSLCFSLFHRGVQVGIARVLTDVGAASYVVDVVVSEDHRARGLGTWLMERILEHPTVRETRVVLITKDAQAFYRALGFQTHPYECMKREPTG
jgi:GNAT superfamily N-acetyltransferase